MAVIERRHRGRGGHAAEPGLEHPRGPAALQRRQRHHARQRHHRILVVSRGQRLRVRRLVSRHRDGTLGPDRDPERDRLDADPSTGAVERTARVAIRPSGSGRRTAARASPAAPSRARAPASASPSGSTRTPRASTSPWSTPWRTARGPPPRAPCPATRRPTPRRCTPTPGSTPCRARPRRRASPSGLVPEHERQPERVPRDALGHDVVGAGGAAADERRRDGVDARRGVVCLGDVLRRGRLLSRHHGGESLQRVARRRLERHLDGQHGSAALERGDRRRRPPGLDPERRGVPLRHLVCRHGLLRRHQRQPASRSSTHGTGPAGPASRARSPPAPARRRPPSSSSRSRAAHRLVRGGRLLPEHIAR